MTTTPRGEAPPAIVQCLTDLRLRAGERFSYVYDHSAPWEHELRVGAISPGRLGCHYLRCIAGQQICPPEWCAGPEPYDEIKAELLGLSYSEDLQVMAEFGRAVVAARNDTVGDVLAAVDVDQLISAPRPWQNEARSSLRRTAQRRPGARRRANAPRMICRCTAFAPCSANWRRSAATP